MQNDGSKRLHLWGMRLVWFVVLWCAGLGAVSCLAFIIRTWLKA